MINEEEILHEIFTNILKGKSYGKLRKGWTDYCLYLIDNERGYYIGWTHYGSSAHKVKLSELKWILEKIFKMTPSEFVKEYELLEY